MTATNAANDTLLSASFAIEGKPASAIQEYYCGIISQRENAEPLCTNFHSFPSYEELFKIISDKS